MITGQAYQLTRAVPVIEEQIGLQLSLLLYVVGSTTLFIQHGAEAKIPTEEMPARMCLVCPGPTTNVDQVDLWRLPKKEGPAISLALSKMHRATEHCSTWTVWSVV